MADRSWFSHPMPAVSPPRFRFRSRNRGTGLDPPVRALVDQIYALEFVPERPDKPALREPTAAGLALSLPRVSTNSLAGMLEEIAAPALPGAASNLRISPTRSASRDRRPLPSRRNAPASQAGRCQGSTSSSLRSARVRRHGRRRAQEGRGRQQSLANVPLASHVERCRRTFLAPGACEPLREELEDDVRDYADAARGTVIDWPLWRLFPYDEHGQTFSYENPE